MARTEGKPGLNYTAQGRAMEPGHDMPLSALPTGMTQTRTLYQQAISVQKPRVLKEVIARVLEEAAYAGEGFIYSYRVKSKDSKEADGKAEISGVSIDGAEIILRNWPNAGCEIEVAEDAPTHWVFRATIVDIETGVSMPRLYRQRKSESHGKFDQDRALDIAFQIGQSKAIRNAVVHGLPRWLQDRAVDAARDKAAEAYKDPKAFTEALAKARAYAADALKVPDADAKLQALIGKPFADWLPRDLVRLRSVYRAIADRQTTVADEFGAVQLPTPPESQPATGAATSPQDAPAAGAAPTGPEPTPAAAQPAATPARDIDPVTGEVVPTEEELAAARAAGQAETKDGGKS